MQSNNQMSTIKYMQKRLMSLPVLLLLLIIVSLSVCSLQAQAKPELLVDEQDLLTSEQEANLLERLEQLSDRLDTDVIIYIPMTMPTDLEKKEVDQFAYDYVAENEYGRGSKNSAVLLLISRMTDETDGQDYMYYSIAGTGTAQDKLFYYNDKAGDTEGKVRERLKEYKENGFSGNGVYRACEIYLDDVEHDMQGFTARWLGVIAKFNFALVFFALVIAFIISAIVMRIQKGKLISIRHQKAADAYIDGGVQLAISRDNFVNRTLSQTKIQKESGSGGGHSSMSSGSSGGRSFSSHSGRV